MTALLRHPGCRAAWTSCAGRGGGSLTAHRARGTLGTPCGPAEGGRSREGDRVPWDGVSRSRRIPGLPRPSVLPALGRFPRGVSWRFPVRGEAGIYLRIIATLLGYGVLSLGGPRALAQW